MIVRIATGILRHFHLYTVEATSELIGYEGARGPAFVHHLLQCHRQRIYGGNVKGSIFSFNISPRFPTPRSIHRLVPAWPHSQNPTRNPCPAVPASVTGASGHCAKVVFINECSGCSNVNL